MAQQKRLVFDRKDIPIQWYNIQVDVPAEPLLPPHPATRKPMAAEDLSEIFSVGYTKRELDHGYAWADTSEEALDIYKYYHSTPLVRVHTLEKALDTPAHIYSEDESINPLSPHKVNSAIPRCYYCKKEGVTNVIVKTGASQWGAALSYAVKVYGLEAVVYQMKIPMQQKPYRSPIMRTFGVMVEGSPSMSTRTRKDIVTRDLTHPDSLGTTTPEAIELAKTTPNCKYTLGSVLNHVALHQTIIGLEAEKQMEMAREYPDKVIACFSGGSNFDGIVFPFIYHNILEGKNTEFIAAEPNSCSKLARGRFEHNFGNKAGYIPLLPTFTLSHDSKPASIRTSGLRYHGADAIVSQLLKDGCTCEMDIPQLESFEAGILFSCTEGTILAPEGYHVIAAITREVKKAKEIGKEDIILFCLPGHGLIDMTAYDTYINSDLGNYTFFNDEIEKNLETVPEI